MSGPTLRQRLKPLELVGLSAVFAAFTGIVVAITVRDPTLAIVFAGVAFILGLVVFAMLALVAAPREGNGEDGPVLDRERPVEPRRPEHH